MAYAGFGLLVALRTRNVQATQSSFLLFFPLLFLTPNFVPFDRLSPLMETLALNPVSYVIVGLRSLVIDGWNVGNIAVCVLVIVVMGTGLTGLLPIALSSIPIDRLNSSPPVGRSVSRRRRAPPGSRPGMW